MEKKNHFHIQKAVIFSVGAAFSFSLMSFFVKLLSSYTNTSMIIFFRFGVSFLYVLVVLGIRNLQNRKISLKTNYLTLQIFRAIISLLAMFLFYFSLKYIPLVEGNLLIMTNSLFIPVLGFIFLKHKINKKHWGAVILGFIGVALILKPGHALFNPMSIFAFLAGLSIAVGLLSLRVLSKNDNPYTCMFYYFLIAFVLSAWMSLFYWKTPDGYTTLLLLAVGVFAVFYQEFLIRASSYAPAKITSALLYTSLVFSTLFGWFFFKNIPDLVSWSGIVIVCFSSILVIRYATVRDKK
jgi:drug/metabolite transporter (DMT)-like permease